jgi:hypothetical protein
VSATAAVSRGTQDDEFLPHTVNTRILSTVPEVSMDSLPARSLDGRYTRVVLDGRLRSRLASGVNGTLRAHFQDYDNQTDQLHFPGVVAFDQVFNPGEVSTDPVSNRQQVYGLDLNWSPMSRVGLKGTAEYRLRDRTFREIESDEEAVVAAEANVRPLDEVSFGASWRHGNRVPEAFLVEAYMEEDGTFIEQPALRRFDTAARRQDLVGADLVVSPSPQLDFSVNYDYSLNRYPESPLGLQYEESHGAIGQVAYALLQNVSVRGGYGWSQLRTHQRSMQASPPIPTPGVEWTARIEDRNDFVFAGADWMLVPRKWTIVGDYVFSRDQTEYDLNNATATAVDLPDTYHRRHEVRLDVRRNLRAGFEVIGRYGYDAFQAEDFAIKNIPIAGITGTNLAAIYLGDNVRNYDAHRVALLVSRRF